MHTHSRARHRAAMVMVVVTALFSVSLLCHRVYRDAFSIASAEAKLGDVRTAPEVGKAIKRRRTVEELDDDLTRLPSLSMVPNAPLRERYLQLRARYGWSYAEVADRAELYRSNGFPDGPRVKRALGLCADRRRLITYDLAVKLCWALDMYPYDAGV